jgi:hypothetical protein
MDKRLAAHPAIAAMEKRQVGESLTVVQGFVGSSSGDVVRIYPFLTLERFIEIPQAGIVHVDEIPDSGGMIRVFVDGATEVTIALTRTRVVTAEDARRAFGLENSDPPRSVAMAQKDDPVLTDDERRQCIFDCWIANPDSFFKQLRCEAACFEREGRDLMGGGFST